MRVAGIRILVINKRNDIRWAYHIKFAALVNYGIHWGPRITGHWRLKLLSILSIDFAYAGLAQLFEPLTMNHDGGSDIWWVWYIRALYVAVALLVHQQIHAWGKFKASLLQGIFEHIRRELLYDSFEIE